MSLKQRNGTWTQRSCFRGWVEDPLFSPPPPTCGWRHVAHGDTPQAPLSLSCVFPLHSSTMWQHGRRGPNIRAKNSYIPLVNKMDGCSFFFLILNTDCELVYKVTLTQCTTLNLLKLSHPALVSLAGHNLRTIWTERYFIYTYISVKNSRCCTLGRRDKLISNSSPSRHSIDDIKRSHFHPLMYTPVAFK